MTELMVCLDFACVTCESTFGVTVQCEGPNLGATGRVVASVAVPCPHCHQVNEVVFEPNGTVLDVRTPSAPRPRTQLCWN